MSDRRLRLLLLADTHLGFDLPHRPRVERRRRGPDFFANYRRALGPARLGEVDLVIHGGDLLFRSRVRRELAYRALAPLVEVAASGVPVVLVPGNHERSAIPYPLLASHPGLYLVDRPSTLRLETAPCPVEVVGFPFQREAVGERFPSLMQEAVSMGEPAGSSLHAAGESRVRLLCLHQTIEGARVGPTGYTFRRGSDVVRGRDIPRGFAAVLAGHIHRHQVLTRDLAGRSLAAPVLYPGSIERTSFAERDEAKGFLTLELEPTANGGRLTDWTFHQLPTRPMIDVEIDGRNHGASRLSELLRQKLASLDPDAVVRLSLRGPIEPGAAIALTADRLRSLAPDTMNLTLFGPRRAAPEMSFSAAERIRPRVGATPEP